MRTLILLLFASLLMVFRPCKAQELQTSLDYRPAKDELIQAFPSSLGTTILFSNGYNVRCFVLNEQFQLLRRIEATLGDAYIGRTRLGAVDLGDRLYLLFEEGNSHFAVAIHKFTGKIEEYPLESEEKGKTWWLASIPSETGLFVLKMLKKTGTIRLYHFQGEQKFRFQDYVLSSPEWSSRLEAYRNGTLPVGRGDGSQEFVTLFGEEVCLVFSGAEGEILNIETDTTRHEVLAEEALLTSKTPVSGLESKGKVSFWWKGQMYTGSYDTEEKAFVIRR